MEYSNKVSEHTVTNSGKVRESLLRNGFYDNFKLEDLIYIIKTSPISENIVDVRLDQSNCGIEVIFKDSYIDNQMMMFRNDILMQTLYNGYIKYANEIVSIMKDSSILAQKNLAYTTMYYHSYNLGNSLFINFV